MRQRNAPHLYASVLKDDLVRFGVHLMECNLVVDAFAIEPFHNVKKCPKLFGRMDVELGGAAKQGHGADEAGQSEDGVAVVVADEDVTQSAQVEPLPVEGHLCRLAAVYHEQFAAQTYDLAGGLVSAGRPGRTAPQDVYREKIHVSVVCKKRSPLLGSGLLGYVLASVAYYSPFCILAFSAASASRSPRVVLAAWFWITGASSF